MPLPSGLVKGVVPTSSQAAALASALCDHEETKKRRTLPRSFVTICRVAEEHQRRIIKPVGANVNRTLPPVRYRVGSRPEIGAGTLPRLHKGRHPVRQNRVPINIDIGAKAAISNAGQSSFTSGYFRQVNNTRVRGQSVMVTVGAMFIM